MIARAIARAYSTTGAAWQHGPGRVYDRLAAELVARSPVTLADRLVLDLGAGTGAATRAIRAAGGTPIASDLAIGMLLGAGPSRPPSAVSDARALPFADQSFDGVVAAFSLNHVPDPEHALREAARVARRGSPVLVSAYATGDAHPVKAAVDVAAAELGWRPDAWVDELHAVSIPLLASVESARQVAQEAGMVDAVVQQVQVAFPDLGADDLVAWRCGMAQMAPFIAGLTTEQQDVLRATAVELLGTAPTLVRHVVVMATLV